MTFDQRQTPADFFENGVGWQDLGNVQFIGDPRVVQLTDEAGPPGSFVVADAVRMERAGGAPWEPEIEVTVDGADVPDGTGLVSFGSTKISKPKKPKTITVRNVGLLDLSLGTITVPYGSACWQTSARRYWHPARPPALSCNSMHFLEIAMPGVVSFGTDDGDENPFDFGVSGTVTQSANCSNCHSAAN